MILDGKKVAAEIYEELKNNISKLEKKPTLWVILVWENPASLKYIAQKKKWAEYIGMWFKLCQLDSTISEDTLIIKIREWNSDNNISGYLVQLPLPKEFNVLKIIEYIAPEKDIDGFHPINQWKLMIWDSSGSIPCTPAGIMHLLQSQNIELRGKEITIVWRSNIVWKPLALLLINAWATVTSCNSSTKNLKLHTKIADIVIVAAWYPHLIGANDISDECIVIDVWFNFMDWKIMGDCDFEEIHTQWNLITPVPWWVGPMTVAMLMKNTYNSYINHL
mgnify:CR=1 FL=1